jgi:hypothetical protein
MPVSKPTSTTRWGETSSNITEPALSYKQAGWLTGVAPPSAFENWKSKKVEDWLLYLQDLENQNWTWAGTQTFNGAVVFGSTVSVSGLLTVNSITVNSDINIAGHITSTNTGNVLTATASGATITVDVLTVNSNANLPVEGKTTLGTGISGYPKPTVWQDAHGAVHVEGAHAHSGDVASATIFAAGTIPSGMRPTATVRAICYAEDNAATKMSALLTIGTDGSVAMAGIGGSTKSVWFNVVYLPSIAGGP